MNESELLAGTVNRQLVTGAPLVLVSIMSLEGSTPRHGGAKMVVTADGRGCGTIGGSLIEAAAVSAARDALAAGKSRTLSFELTGEDANAPGMICGGRAEILLDYLAASPENVDFSRRWYEAILQGKDCYLITRMIDDGDAFRVLGHAILFPDGELHGNASLTAVDIEKIKPELHNVSTTVALPLGDSRVMIDLIRKLKTLYCFGAGHVAVPTVHLAALVGFRVVVLDDRAEYVSAARFPEAHERRIVGDFNRAFEGLEIDGDSYIVIVTRGHRYDRTVLEQALKTSAGYIGMIGSRPKRDAVYEALLDAGVKKEKLEQVHSPIGIDIGGETPEEIAVSIVAELIRVRSGQGNR